jgi:hypothetical protein
MQRRYFPSWQPWVVVLHFFWSGWLPHVGQPWMNLPATSDADHRSLALLVKSVPAHTQPVG